MSFSGIVYKPVGMVVGALGGVLASAVFKRVWKVAGHEGDAPNATDEDRTWSEVLLAAALQGAVFALVKAALDRTGAVAVGKATGHWPTGNDG
ncbi:DUF4235 domain-containing protein [Kitasatospora sp. DSM 101779]|uniref:DUF4235 domain-containing protein n=1 Tax=Kitasatospora sp. DSM 101779 TaxID=2853165 RepID=UPI0021D8F57F|nr:DUF4235 domain-containing protein [Kitasatospora sp. DSM 101779]MCU7820281.1 DUF4235 domain-containing protein [Kitasatospora sp. DSM 101779]